MPEVSDKKFDAVTFTMAYEAGDLCEEEIIAGFQELINCGLAWQLQGSYGRMATSLIEAGSCTRPAPKPQEVGKSTKVGPFEMVSRDIVREVDDEKYRLVLYGAYNAMGLIGSECNGIAVLSEDRSNVVCDELGKEASGYYGASAAQKKLFDTLSTCSADEFRTIVNAHTSRLRYRI